VKRLMVMYSTHQYYASIAKSIEFTDASTFFKLVIWVATYCYSVNVNNDCLNYLRLFLGMFDDYDYFSKLFFISSLISLCGKIRFWAYKTRKELFDKRFSQKVYSLFFKRIFQVTYKLILYHFSSNFTPAILFSKN
jgi:hypothetical protein